MKRYALILLAFCAANVGADPVVRCGNVLLQSGVGTSQYLVAQKCGEPTFRDGNRWIYDRGESFITILVFKENGELTFVEDEFAWR